MAPVPNPIRTGDPDQQSMTRSSLNHRLYSQTSADSSTSSLVSDEGQGNLPLLSMMNNVKKNSLDDNCKGDVEVVENLSDAEARNAITSNRHGRRHKDRAAELLDHTPQAIIVTPEENRRLLRRIDLTILPILLAVYFLQGLDKATLSYASVFGLVKDAHLKGEDYSWLGSIVYVAQLVMQPIVAYFLVKLPTGKFAAAMVLCWGIVLSCMALATNFKGLLATRFFLGAFEASIGE